MDMCLTGRMMDAEEAERCGLVSRLVAPEDLIEEALKAAERIASFSQPSVQMVKESVNRSYETTLDEGLRFERRLFHSLLPQKTRKKACPLSSISARQLSRIADADEDEKG